MDRGLIDTGAQANIIPLSLVTKQGWVYQPATITTIRSYNNETAPVAGVLKCSLKFGPMKKAEDVEFLITSGLSDPIIGIGTLQMFGMTVNCRERTLQNQSGEIVKCAMTTKIPQQKNA